MSFQSDLQNGLDAFYPVSSTAVISWRQLRKGIILFIKYAYNYVQTIFFFFFFLRSARIGLVLLYLKLIGVQCHECNLFGSPVFLQ